MNLTLRKNSAAVHKTAAVFVFLISVIFLSSDNYNQDRLSQFYLVFSLAFICLVDLLIGIAKGKVKNPLVVSMVIIFLAAFFLPIQSRSFLMYFLFFQFLFLIPVLCCRYISSSVGLLCVLIFTGIFVLINSATFIVFFSQVVSGDLHKYDTLIGFSNPRFYGHVQLVFISVVLGFVLDKRPSSLLSSILVVLIAFTLFHAIILGSRAVIVGVLAVSVVSVFFAHERGRALYICVSFWTLVSMFLCTIIFLFDLSITQQLVDRGSSGRILLWSEAIISAVNNAHAFFFGHGYNDFQHVVLDTGREEKHPHNIFLDFSFRFGVIVGGGMAVLVLLVFSKLVRRRLKGGGVALTKVLPVAAVIVAANFTAIYVPAISQVMLAILLIYSFSGVELPLLRKHSQFLHRFLYPVIAMMLLASTIGVVVTLDALQKEDATSNRIYPYLFAD